ncbi:MAG: serine protease, partial [Burkholderiales bacterium]
MTRMYRDLYNRISAACCYITVFLDDEKISEGTGFAFRGDGQIITAAHVVTGRTPIRKEDYLDPNARIYVKFPERPVAQYRVLFCGLTIVVEALREPVQIDLAMLAPVELSGAPYAHIPARIKPPDLGDEVFLAGYSDELELPFLVDQLLRPETQGAATFFEAMNKGY